MLPDEKKQPMNDEVKEIENRMEILKKTDGRLEFILDFNKRLAAFNQVRAGRNEGENSSWTVMTVILSAWRSWRPGCWREGRSWTQ